MKNLLNVAGRGGKRVNLKWVRELESFMKFLDAKLGREASDKDYARALGVSFKEYAEILALISGPAVSDEL